MHSVEQQTSSAAENQSPSLQYLIIIEPLGFLYGSAGRFLSPENLVGRSGTQFPPSAATLSGIFAATLTDETTLHQLQLAGPFWSYCNHLHNFYVPTPFNCLVKDKQIQHQLIWHSKKEQWVTCIDNKWDIPPDDKYDSGTWFPIASWKQLQHRHPDLTVFPPPWKFIPHLHPRLREDERRTVDPEDDRGSLFLENSVQLSPDACLVYLSNTKIDDGCYRFGGEGHLVDLRCKDISADIKELLTRKLTASFTLITSAIWGSNRLSYRSPNQDKQGKLYWGDILVTALFTQRPHQMRYRLGEFTNHLPHQPKILSRGRYAVPAGSVYILEKSLDKTWQELPDTLFPKEEVSFKRWGCGLALPLGCRV